MKHLTRLMLVGLLAVACSDALLDVSSAATPAAAAPKATPAATTPPVRPVSQLGLIEDENNTIDVFDAASQATVYVTQTQVVRDWSRGTIEVPGGTGSGFIWDTQGHVVTNFHVVDGGRHFKVTLPSGREVEATFVGGEPLKDVAVLKIDVPPEGLTAIRLPAQGEGLRVGQKAIAIGNPFGLDKTLTVGVISALGRDVEGFGGVTIRDMVQTDASINPGNSGGPLLDSRGQLIGMNTMIFSRSGSSAGIGFAVPTPTIRRVVNQIITTGKPQRVGLGVSLVPDHLARRQGIRGVVIDTVSPGSPAHQAGLRGLERTRYGVEIGDVIVSINGAEVTSFDDLYNELDPHDPGEQVQVTLLRKGERIELPVTLYLLDR